MPFDIAAWAPIIGASISAAASGAATGVSATANRRSYHWTRKLQEYQNAYNYAMWNKQNEYNTPSAMMQRFKDAGVNPMLVTGQGNGGNAGSVAPASSAIFQDQFRTVGDPAASAVNLLNSIAEYRKRKADIDNTNQDTENKKLESDLIHQRALHESTLNAMDMFRHSKMLPRQLDQLNATIAGIGIKNNLLSLQRETQHLTNRQMQYQLDYLLPLQKRAKEIGNAAALYNYQYMLPAELRNKNAQTQLYTSQGLLNGKTVEKLGAEIIGQELRNWNLNIYGTETPASIKAGPLPVGAFGYMTDNRWTNFKARVKGLKGKPIFPRPEVYYPTHF